MAAITLKQSNTGIVDRYGVGAPMLDKSLDAVVELWNALPMQGARFFRTVTPAGGAYKEQGIDNILQLPVENADSDRMPFATSVKGFPKNFTTTEFRLAVQMERRLSDEDITGKAKSLMGGLMDSYRRLLEYSFANVLNQAVSTATAYQGSDGVSLANSGHPFRIRQEGVWSNIETAAAFTQSAFSTARTNMRKRKNHFGYITPMVPELVVVCPDKEEAVRRVISSEKVAGGSLNDKNVFQNSVDIFVYDYASSTTVWMLFAQMPSESKGLVYGPEVPGNIQACTGQDAATDIIWAERLRTIFFCGFTVVPEIQYNSGA